MNAREVLGATVHDRNGRAVGSIEEIVVDRLTGRVSFAVVLLRDAEGDAEATFLPVPWSALTTSDEDLRLAIAARSVADDAPTMASDELDELERRDVSVEVFSYYGVQPPWEGDRVE